MANTYYQSEARQVVLARNNQTNKVELYISNKIEAYSDWYTYRNPIETFPMAEYEQALSKAMKICPIYINKQGQRIAQVSQPTLGTYN